MKLQLLVPHCREGEDVVKSLLDSVMVQQNIDFSEIGVVIADDGDGCEPLSDGFVARYPFRIDRIKAPKGGVSSTRNFALDHATADYVMFCDADDMFFNALGVHLIFREMGIGGGFEGLVSNFTEETRDPADKTKVVYVNHEMDSTFVHGKVYSRRFLTKNKLRWNDGLTVHEDSYFNFLCQRVGSNFRHCPMPFYLWKWRDESVCRHDPKYILKTYNNMIESSTALVNELRRRGKIEAACEMAVQMTFDSYYTMNKKEWLEQENQEYRVATESRFAKYYDEFEFLIDSIGDEKRSAIIMGIRNRMFAEGMMLEEITFKDWIAHIREIRRPEQQETPAA